jgi:hypothetical protein
MIREIIRPTNNHPIIQIPNEYINQDIEFIAFPIGSKKLNNETILAINELENGGGKGFSSVDELFDDLDS